MSTRACGVADCDRPYASRGYCGPHAKNWRKYGSPIAPDRKGRNHPKWAGSTPTYAGAHWRVRNQYGEPSLHLCVDCGDSAREWAYDHLDPDELTHRSRKGDHAYSANPAHYMAMCKTCHTFFDRRHHALLPANRQAGTPREREEA